MNNRSDRKLDLLKDCNDQGVPPNEFKGIFCNRCRNDGCVNAGWSESRWGDRMATQVHRLIENPTFADPNDPNFRDLRDLDFREVREPIVLVGGDPWEPRVHLADPNREVRQSSEVEDAVAALRGNLPKRAVEASTAPSIAVEPQPVTQPTTNAPTPVRENPKHYVFDTQDKKSPAVREVNTAFPNEGVMLDGSPPTPNGPVEDPWNPPPVSQSTKVAVGARVRMGGGEGPKK